MKRERTAKKGFGEVPFPHARQSPSQRKQNEFLETHGAASTRAFFCILVAIEDGAKALPKIICRLVKSKKSKANIKL